MSEQGAGSFILGLDLGPNSLGWALVRTSDGNPKAIESTGVRVFEAGLENLETDGRGVSRNVDRRMARQTRRLLERRVRRMQKVALMFQRAGLLPEGDLKDSVIRHALFTVLDGELDNPYRLRARALDEALSPVELGRALYHLAQRRGFLSNRKSIPKKTEEEGEIKKGITALSSQMAKSGARTLGEMFSTIDPRQERIRSRYTSRQMYEDEFRLICQKQKPHHAVIWTDALEKQLHRAIFYQRPLKSAKGLVGKCELEKGRTRAPWALLLAQRFRYLQTLNNLQIIDQSTGEIRPLNEDERVVITNHLELTGEVTFGSIRRLLPQLKHTVFNLETGGEKKMYGNRVASKLIGVFGKERWQSFTPEQKDAVVEDWLSIQNAETLCGRGKKYWELDEDQAAAFAMLSLEPGYCRFSRQALLKLLPKLETGMPLQTAIKECYPERWARAGQAVEQLPPVESDEMPVLRNPVVERTLTEMRRVVNAIIRQYGTPDEIRVELGRELRQTGKQRKDTTKRIRDNEDAREAAAARAVEEAGVAEPSRTDVLKVLLWEECEGTCPYTGRPIPFAGLFGDHPEFDIEHIIPFNRSLDDSFHNKTLCWAEENRNVKRNRTPYEAYQGTDKWDDIVARIKRFRGGAAREKARRFQLRPHEVEQSLNNFTERQLNDTRWASRWAKRYLGLLYGGVKDDGIDGSGKRRVQATGGQVTAFLRNEWQLNSILGDGPGKSRDDHRHHAVDALVIALTDHGTVKLLSDAARGAARARRRLFASIQTPWDGFVEQARDAVKAVTVSHRLSRRVRGALHEQTFYGSAGTGTDGKNYVIARTPLASLTAKDVELIVDPTVREIVRKKLAELGGDPKTAFKNDKNLPVIEARNGGRTPIRRVRIRYPLTTFQVGEGDRLRHVKSDTNHHMALFEVRDEKTGRVKWAAEVVSTYEAYQRLHRKEPIVKRDLGPGRSFLFSVACGDAIELDAENRGRALYVIRSIPMSKQIRYVPISDARKLKDISKKGQTAYPDGLRERKCRRVIVTPLGEVRYAND